MRRRARRWRCGSSALDGVTGVFLGADFVSVSKDDDASWSELKPAVLGALMEHFTAGEPLPDEALPSRRPRKTTTRSSSQIKELLETRVRPAVAQDGGDIIFEALRRRRRLSPDARLVLGLPELDRDLEGRHREHAAPLHPRSGRSPRASSSRARHHRPVGASASPSSGITLARRRADNATTRCRRNPSPPRSSAPAAGSDCAAPRAESRWRRDATAA